MQARRSYHFAFGMIAIIAGCSEPNAPLCGNGVLDPSEACDDGNRESGDACTSACQIPGTPIECTTMLEGKGYDEVNALSSLPDLSFVAAGGKYIDGHRVGWIGRYDDSGGQIWQTLPPPADDSSDSIIDVAADSSGGFWALLARGSDEELIHFDSSGQVDTRLFVSNLIASPVVWVAAHELLVEDRHIWLAGGGNDGSPGGYDTWLGRFDIETQSLTTMFIEDYLGYHDTAWTLASSESEITIAATVDTSPSQIGDEGVIPHSNVLLIRFNRGGQEVGRHLLASADPETATDAYAIAADGSGGWIVGGEQHGVEIFSPQEAWVARVQPNEGSTWTWTSAGPAEGYVVEDVLVTDREVVVAGVSPAEGEARGWLLGLGFDGAPNWEHVFDVQGYTDSAVSAIVTDHAGRLRMAVNSRYDPWKMPSDDDGASLSQSCLVAW